MAKKDRLPGSLEALSSKHRKLLALLTADESRPIPDLANELRVNRSSAYRLAKELENACLLNQHKKPTREAFNIVKQAVVFVRTRPTAALRNELSLQDSDHGVDNAHPKPPYQAVICDRIESYLRKNHHSLRLKSIGVLSGGQADIFVHLILLNEENDDLDAFVGDYLRLIDGVIETTTTYLRRLPKSVDRDDSGQLKD